MSASSLHTKYPLTSLHHLPRTIHARLTSSITTPTKPRPQSQKLEVDPRLIKLPPPRFNDPSLQSTWSHRLWVTAGCTTVFTSLTKSIIGSFDSHMLLQPIIAGYIGYILADLGSGVYHWGIDNYGDESTPIFGTQIEAFQGHHKWPWTITKRQFANNLHALARVITFVVLPLNLTCNDPLVHGFVSVCAFCIMFSQQFHAWAHSTKSKLPRVVVALQDVGVLVSRSQHAAHHRPPYNNNYCIVSGIWNKVLDESKIFEALEMVMYFQLGVRPRSWSEPNSDWTEETTQA